MPEKHLNPFDIYPELKKTLEGNCLCMRMVSEIVVISYNSRTVIQNAVLVVNTELLHWQ